MADQYLILIVEGEWDETQATPDNFASEMVKHQAFMTAVTDAGGTVVSGEALTAETSGFRIEPDGEPSPLPSSPLSSAAEAITGFYVIEAESLDLAKRLAAQCPTGGHIELRPIWDMQLRPVSFAEVELK